MTWEIKKKDDLGDHMSSVDRAREILVKKVKLPRDAFRRGKERKASREARNEIHEEQGEESYESDLLRRAREAIEKHRRF